MEIVEVTEVTQALIDAFVKLTPQLSSSNPPPSPEVLEEIVGAGATVLFAAVHSEQIVGALTLATYRIPTGLRLTSKTLSWTAKRGEWESGERSLKPHYNALGTRAVALWT